VTAAAVYAVRIPLRSYLSGWTLGRMDRHNLLVLNPACCPSSVSTYCSACQTSISLVTPCRGQHSDPPSSINVFSSEFRLSLIHRFRWLYIVMGVDEGSNRLSVSAIHVGTFMILRSVSDFYHFADLYGVRCTCRVSDMVQYDSQYDDCPCVVFLYDVVENLLPTVE